MTYTDSQWQTAYTRLLLVISGYDELVEDEDVTPAYSLAQMYTLRRAYLEGRRDDPFYDLLLKAGEGAAWLS